MQADDDQLRRRARAIWGYSRQPQDRLADDAGIHYDRLRAMLGSAGRPPTTDELLALARVARVPERFVLHGFADEIEERLARLEELVSSRLRGVGAPPIPGDTGRRLEDRPPTGQDRPLPGSEPANGSR